MIILLITLFVFNLEPGDYDRIDTVLTFTPQTTRQSLLIGIGDDSLIESTETFSLRLFPFEEEPSVVFSPSMTVISIIDNDSMFKQLLA